MSSGIPDSLQLAVSAVASPSPGTVGPLVTALWWRVLVVMAGAAATMALSGPLVRRFIVPREVEPEPRPALHGRPDPGTVIGKCENLLALTFVLAGELTALSLIFAAKSLVRTEEIRREPGYFLVGFLVNFVWSVVMGFLLRIVVIGV